MNSNGEASQELLFILIGWELQQVKTAERSGEPNGAGHSSPAGPYQVEAVGSWLGFSSTTCAIPNFCRAPRPRSLAKPPSGTRPLPVTNCRSSATSDASHIVAHHTEMRHSSHGRIRCGTFSVEL